MNMIDLNKQSSPRTEEGTPVGIQILALLPLACLFWTLIEWGLK